MEILHIAIVLYFSVGLITTLSYREQFIEDEEYNAVKYSMYAVKHFGFWTFMFVWLTWIVTLPYVKWWK